MGIVAIAIELENPQRNREGTIRAIRKFAKRQRKDGRSPGDIRDDVALGRVTGEINQFHEGLRRR